MLRATNPFGLRESYDIGIGEREEYCVLFSGQETQQLAEDILKEHPMFLRKGEISWGKFEDGMLVTIGTNLVLGFPNLFIQNVEQIRGRDVTFLASFLNHAELLANLSGSISGFSLSCSFVYSPSISHSITYYCSPLFPHRYYGES